MSILTQLAPSFGDLFKLTILIIMAVTIGMLVVSMASAYEATAMVNLGIDGGFGSMLIDTERFHATDR